MNHLSLVPFARALRAPTPVADDDEPTHPRSYQYARLAQVSLLDTYYNASQEACPDFTFWPTPTTADLMTDLGLLLRNNGTSFTVLYDERRREGLLEFLRSHYNEDPQKTSPCCPDPDKRTGEPGVWTRLTFVLALNNPTFLNFTDLPIGLNPSVFNLYFTNQEAHRVRGSGLLLNPGPHVVCPLRPTDQPKPGVSQMLTVIDGQYPVPTLFKDRQGRMHEADCVRVVDVRGEVMVCQQRCVPVRPGQPRLVCRERVYLDLSTLPLGKYEIQWVAGGAVARRLPVLYTDSYPVPLALVDLFLTDPGTRRGQPDSGADLYPVRNLWTRPEVKGLNYRLRFRRRATTWNYYIVSAAALDDLRIEGPAAFSGPTRVVLADGRRAYRFVSETELALEQESLRRFVLHGRPADGPRELPLYDPLPLAAPRQVVAARAPHSGLATATRADLYVYLHR